MDPSGTDDSDEGVRTAASSTQHGDAYEALSKIEKWTSPRLKSRPEVYDADVWFQQEMQSEIQMHTATDMRRTVGGDDFSASSSSSSGKQQKQQQRSTTPIMSNYSTPLSTTRTPTTTTASSARGNQKQPPSSVFTKSITNRDDDRGVDTPFRPFVAKTPARPMRGSVGAATPMSHRASHRSVVRSTRQDAVHRQYHDALWTFLQQRHRLMSTTTSFSEQQEQQLDLSFFTSLEVSKDAIGLWLLLKHLRKLGDHQPLISKPYDVMQRKQELNKLLVQTAAKAAQASSSTDKSSTSTTPARLVEYIPKESPYLRRRKALYEWLQEWIRKDLAKGSSSRPTIATDRVMWPNTLQELKQNSSFSNPNKVPNLHPDAPVLLKNSTITTTALFGSDVQKDREMLEKCWSFIQAAMYREAMETTKQYGQAWRSALWKGGQWYDVVAVPNHATQTMTRKVVGNPNYFVWKNKIRTLAKQQALEEEERIIHAYMSGDVQTLLSLLARSKTTATTSSSSSSSWRSGLLGCCAASIQNVEELAVHLWFAQLRQQTQQQGTTPMIPGSDTVQAEEECIALAQRLETEQDMLDTLNAMPQTSLQSSADFLRRTLAMLVLGQDVSLEAWCTQESSGIGTTSSGGTTTTATKAALSDNELRWMVHLLVYLEQLQQQSDNNNSSSKLLPSDLKPLSPIKNQVVLAYVQRLSAQPSLWRLLALYASLLSTEQLVDVLPPLLVPMEEPEERNYMVRAMQDCFAMSATTKRGDDDDDDAGSMLVQQLLMQTVHLILLDNTKSFATKALAIGWLGVLPHHASAGLICANQLCRQLMLVKETSDVVEFLELYCPKSILQYDDSDDDEDEYDNYGAQRELRAIQAYLDASAAFDQWKNMMEKAVAEMEDNDEEDMLLPSSIDDTKKQLLSTHEQEMLTTLNRRSKSQQLEKMCEQVGQVALEACMKLRSVLEFDGGWLVDRDDNERNKDEESDDDDEEAMETDDDDEIPMDPKRLEEMELLRRIYIPDVIFLMHNICDETSKYLYQASSSSWMTSSTTKETTYYNPSSTLSPGYWLHMGRTQLTIAAARDFILDVLGQREVRLLTSKVRDLAMRELDWKQELRNQRGY